MLSSATLSNITRAKNATILGKRKHSPSASPPPSPSSSSSSSSSSLSFVASTTPRKNRPLAAGKLRLTSEGFVTISGDWNHEGFDKKLFDSIACLPVPEQEKLLYITIPTWKKRFNETIKSTRELKNGYEEDQQRDQEELDELTIQAMEVKRRMEGRDVLIHECDAKILHCNDQLKIDDKKAEIATFTLSDADKAYSIWPLFKVRDEMKLETTDDVYELRSAQCLRKLYRMISLGFQKRDGGVTVSVHRSTEPELHARLISLLKLRAPAKVEEPPKVEDKVKLDEQDVDEEATKLDDEEARLVDQLAKVRSAKKARRA